MKLHTNKLVLSAALTVVFGCSNAVFASNVVPAAETIQINLNENKWKPVQTIDGITVFMAEILIDQERFLSVKFENTNEDAVDFIWSMTNHGEAVRITADEMTESRIQLEANASIIVDGSYLISLSEHDQLADFTVFIQPTKH